MSRLGRKPVEIPDGAKVAVAERSISVQGPGGTLQQKVLFGLEVKLGDDGKKVLVERKSGDDQARANHGTMRALIVNMLRGVTQGFERSLRISGVGYGAKLQGKSLIMTLGYSHPVEMQIPDGLQVAVPAPEVVVVKGADRQMVGQFAAEVRGKRVIEPYNLKGISYTDEVVKKKAGKTFVSGA